MQAHHHQEQYPHSVDQGGEEHEKKPVLKKVKDKVKKIKDKISSSKKQHGHGECEVVHHEHDEYDVSEEEEGYEEDEEEREADPEVLGAPMYESPAAPNIVSGRDENIGPGKVILGEVIAKTSPVEDPAVPRKGFGVSAASDRSQLLYPSVTETTAVGRRNIIKGRDEHIDPDKVSLRMFAESVEEDPAAPKTGATRAESGPLYPSPTGRDEVGESPLLSSFQAMTVSDDKPKGPKQAILESPLTGTHDQFSPNQPNQEPQQQHAPTYTDKISSTATAAKDAAVSAATTVYGKVSEAGTAIMGKTTNEADQAKPQTDKGVSVKEYIVGKLKPGDEDRALSEVITDAIHTKKQESNVRAGSEESGGKGMVDKIKGAVTSWIGAGSTPGAATKGKQQSPGTSEPGDQQLQQQRQREQAMR